MLNIRDEQVYVTCLSSVAAAAELVTDIVPGIAAHCQFEADFRKGYFCFSSTLFMMICSAHAPEHQTKLDPTHRTCQLLLHTAGLCGCKTCCTCDSQPSQCQFPSLGGAALEALITRRKAVRPAVAAVPVPRTEVLAATTAAAATAAT
jgi:hypothetical protein